MKRKQMKYYTKTYGIKYTDEKLCLSKTVFSEAIKEIKCNFAVKPTEESLEDSKYFTFF